MPTSLRYAALGDSTSVGIGAGGEGYPERLGRRLKETGVAVGFLNLGQSGATSADVLRGQLPRLVAKPAQLVTLGIGGNDAWRLVPGATFAANVERIVEGLAATGAHVVACNIPDLGLAPAARIAQAIAGVTPEAITARICELNAVIARHAHRPRFEVVDLFTHSREELRARPGLFAADGFHPSPAGYDAWAEILWPAMERAARACRAVN